MYMNYNDPVVEGFNVNNHELFYYPQRIAISIIYFMNLGEYRIVQSYKDCFYSIHNTIFNNHTLANETPCR